MLEYNILSFLLLGVTNAAKFTVFNYNAVYDIIDPCYTSNNITSCFETPEQLASYMGSSIYGVSFKGNNTLVDSFGYYHYINETEFKKFNKKNKKSKSKVKKNTNEVREINNLKTKEDYEKYYENLYEKLTDSKPQCIPLVSTEPAYNPYHEDLIIGNNKNANIIYTKGSPLSDNPSVIMEQTKFNFCSDIVIHGNKGISETCTFRISTTIEDSLSISNSKGESYNRSYGVSDSTSDSLADEISNTIDLAKSFTKNNVISHSDSDTNSNALEMATTITNSNSKSSSNETSTTHTKTHDEAYVYTINSEDSHTRTDGGSHSNENNWSENNETSHIEEYNRMTLEDFNNNKKFKRDIRINVKKIDNYTEISNTKPHKRDEFFDSLGKIGKGVVRAASKLNPIGAAFSLVTEGINAGSAAASAVAAFKANSIAEEANKHAKEANDIARNSTEAAFQANNIALASNEIADKGNKIAEKANKIAAKGNKIAERGNEIAEEANRIAISANRIAERGNEIAQEGNEIAREGNVIAREGNAIAREANDIARVSNAIAQEGNNIARESNDIARESNAIASYANRIAERGIESQEEIARLDRELQRELANEDAKLQRELSAAQINNELNIALAGTRSTSTSTTNGSSRGGSVSNTNEWSDAYTSSSGVSNSWSNTDGVSDAYLSGHTENISSEHSQADTISNTVTNSYTSENGWSTEEGISKSFSSANTHGKTTTNTKSTTKSIDESKEFSINNSVEKSHSVSKTYEQSISMDYKPSEEGCYKPALIPKLKTEVTVWACGNKDDNGNISITYHKVYDVIEAYANKNDKMSALIPCEIDDDDYYEKYNPFNNDIAGADYYGDPTKRNAIISGMALGVNEYISGKNKKWYFGLLGDGTLALTQGSFSKKTIRWSTKISDIDNYNPLFEIGNNGHLIITADALGIFNSDITDDEEIKQYVEEKYTNDKYDKIVVENDDLRFSNSRVVIWDSLPKHLPYNVGYYESIGYTLILTDESDNNNVRLTLYDEVGVKIWEIYNNGRGTNFPNYIGYAFPYEYNIPLNSDIIKISDGISKILADNKNSNINKDKKDLHLKLDDNIIDKYKSIMYFDCETILNENEALVSENGIYRFILQKSGNLIIKEGKRTLWSSLTANINGFTNPYKLSLSPKGELVLRDRYNFVVWQTYNSNIIDNENEDINYALVLSNLGELQIINSEEYKIWSSLPYNDLNNHIRYKSLTVYDIKECSENNRIPFNYYLFSSYEVYENSEENSFTKRDGKELEKYYYNNMLPNEKIISNYNSILEISDNKLFFDKVTNDEKYKFSHIISECPKGTKIEEMVLDDNSLYLKCSNKQKIIIGTFKSSNYYKLEIRYDNYLYEPVLVVIDTKTKLVEWSSDNVRYLNYIEEERTYDSNNRIITDNILTTYDRLYSKSDRSSFVYMSNANGLQLKNGSFDTIRELSLTSNNMLINGIPFIKNIKNMRIYYDGEKDKIINKVNNEKIIWELYGSKKCNQIISDNNECNILYTMNDIIINDITLHLVPLGLYINNNYIDMKKYIYEEDVEMKKFYYETIYSLKLTNEGSLILNDKITIFKDSNNLYPPYRLDIINNNLYMRNSINQYLWSTSEKYPSGNSMIMNTIENGEKLYENEIFKCKNFSVEIYDGKIFYNKNNKSVSMFNTYRYISYIYLSPSYILIYDKYNDVVGALYDSKGKVINDKMFIKCDDINDNLVLDDVTCNNNSNSQVWSFWDKNPSDIISAEAHTVLIYNKKLNKCLYSDSSRNTRPKINDCTNSDEAKWSIPVSGDGFYRSFYNDLCLYVTDINKGNIVMRECDSNSIILDINDSYNGNSIVSPLNEDKCLGLMNNNNNNANLSNCDKSKNDQYWEMIPV
ncbi:hypothetical protein BCR32DRAFT_249385 [Anaeromyces robustus]|uniref:Bulb-type lectin domain-containing protein n=1 Tax=Anaeromyces robustus TaxID=1754192 RepID=A0A1Y1WQ51_9FUNG|nr:hypothetical protein BCR32DRAFT_249385 [Anaeromyces robustus]|eukprot:ORX75653.1 hypothetical protein BCR32DRAFT_249385 [Anaeromyces robustus]